MENTTEKLVNALENSLYAEGYSVKIEPMNGRYAFRREGENVSPLLDLASWAQNINGEMLFEKAVSDITGIIVSSFKESWKFKSLSLSSTYGEIRDKLLVCLIGKECIHENPNLMNMVFKDLGNNLLCYYRFLCGEGNMGSIVVSERLFSEWEKEGITREQLHEDALLGTQAKFPLETIYFLESKLKIMPKKMVESIPPEVLQKLLERAKVMFSIKGSRNLYGAGCILYKEEMEKLIKEKSSVGAAFIIPSSVEDVIVIPFRKSEDFSASLQDGISEFIETQEIYISEVNSQLNPRDRLSNTLFFYSPETGLVRARDVREFIEEKVMELYGGDFLFASPEIVTRVAM